MDRDKNKSETGSIAAVKRLVGAAILVTAVDAWIGLSTTRVYADDLPDFAVLLQEAYVAQERAAAEQGDEPSWPLYMLAQAQAYAGDVSGALKAARAIENDFFRGLAMSTSVLAQVECGIFPEELPSDLDGLHLLMTLEGIAKARAEQGHFKEALGAAARIEGESATPSQRARVYLHIAKAQLNDGQPKEATRTLAVAFEAAADRRIALDQIDLLANIALTCRRAGDTEFATRVGDEAAKIAEEDERPDNSPPCFCALQWARVGRVQADLGNAASARVALDRAGELVAGVPVIANEKNPLDAGTFVRIGLVQLHCDRPSDAEKSFRRAVARALSSDDGQQRAYQLCGIVEQRADGADLVGAVSIAAMIEEPYWAALSHAKIAESAFQAGAHALSKRHLEAARQLSDEQSDLKRKSELLVAIGKLLVTCGDASSADATFSRVLETAALLDDEGRIEQAQLLARAQVQSGRFARAYLTLRSMGDSQWRSLPLAELALAVAKANAERRKDAED